MMLCIGPLFRLLVLKRRLSDSVGPGLLGVPASSRPTPILTAWGLIGRGGIPLVPLVILPTLAAIFV